MFRDLIDNDWLIELITISRITNVSNNKKSSSGTLAPVKSEQNNVHKRSKPDFERPPFYFQKVCGSSK